MPMRDDEMIDLLEAGVFDGVHDAGGVAGRGGSCVTGVDEQRFMGRRDKQRGVAAFDIDDVDVQCSARLG